MRTLRRLPVGAWAMAGAAGILCVALAVMAVLSAHRAKEDMSRILLEKGAAIIRAVEAGARTGIRGPRASLGHADRLQILLEETAAQPDLLFLAVTDAGGEVHGHSNQDKARGRLWEPAAWAALAPGEAVQWRVVAMPDGREAFLVYRLFDPLPRGCGQDVQSRFHAWCAMVDEARRHPEALYLFAGLDIAPFEAARREDLRRTLLLTATLAVLGLSGVAALFWAQDASLSRRLLREAQALAGQTLASMPAGCLVLDKHGTVARANAAAARMLGQDLARLEGRPLADVAPTVLASFLADPAPEGREQEMTLPGDPPIPVHAAAAAIAFGQGDPLGRLCILRDLTEVKRLEEAMRRKDRLATAGSLAAGVAHEVRNPLGAIKAAATYFRDASPPHPADGRQGRAMAELMLAEVERLDAVVGELLDLGRPPQASLGPVAVAEVIGRCLDLVRQDAAAQGVSLVLDLPATLPPALGDGDKLLQVLLNLCLNALQALKGSEVADRSLRLSAREDGQRLRLEVLDDGPGLPADILAHLFTPYVTGRPDGSGLGLAMCQRLMEAMGGEIRLENRSDAPGAAATVWLRRADA